MSYNLQNVKLEYIGDARFRAHELLKDMGYETGVKPGTVIDVLDVFPDQVRTGVYIVNNKGFFVREETPTNKFIEECEKVLNS